MDLSSAPLQPAGTDQLEFSDKEMDVNSKEMCRASPSDYLNTGNCPLIMSSPTQTRNDSEPPCTEQTEEQALLHEASQAAAPHRSIHLGKKG